MLKIKCVQFAMLYCNEVIISVDLPEARFIIYTYLCHRIANRLALICNCRLFPLFIDSQLIFLLTKSE